MKTFQEYIIDSDTGSPIVEGVIAGSVISAKLASMSRRVKSEQDLAKKMDLLADMIAFGNGSVAFATNYRGKKR